MSLMRKIWFVMAIVISSAAYSLAEIRDDFHRAAPDKEHLLAVICKSSSIKSSISLAYQGLCEAMMADHLILPTSKLQTFKKGKTKVEEAISKQPENCELRYIRLLIQLNTPKFVNYHKQIPDDLEYFVNNMDTQIKDDRWKLRFIDNLLMGKNLTAGQQKQLKTLKKNHDARSTRSTGR